MTVKLYPWGEEPDAVATTTIGGDPIKVTTTVPGQNAKVTFEGTAGRHVSVKLDGMGSTPVRLLKPDGTELKAGGTGYWGDLWWEDLTLPDAGTYTLAWDPHNIHTGTMTVTIGAVSGTSSASLSTNALGSADVESVSVMSIQADTSGPGTKEPQSQGEKHNEQAAARRSSQPAAQRKERAAQPLDRQEEKSPASDKKATTYPPTTRSPYGRLSAKGVWVPTEENRTGPWVSGLPDTPWRKQRSLRAQQGATAVAGQALTLDGKPLPGVTLSIKDKRVKTDRNGQFLLSGIGPGHHKLLIDGGTANTRGATYGIFEVGTDIAQGRTNVLPYTIWMPKLDIEHAVKITSPTTREVRVTTPYIPGLELVIPAGTTIRDRTGKPVTEISITPIPVDRPPFPMPENLNVPVYFTVQPGGAFISPKGAQLIYPNYTGEGPGSRIDFWHYDPERVYESKDTANHLYGKGTVSEDGQQIIPDKDVRFYEFTASSITIGGGLLPPDWWENLEKLFRDGDPVDLSTGLFVLEKTDMVIPDTLPVSLTRSYRPGDSVSRAFGIGTSHPYDVYLWSPNSWNNYSETYLILPDGGRIHYVRTSPGTGHADAVLEHTESSTAFYGSKVTWNQARVGWDLTFKDGTVWALGMSAPLQYIADRHGNRITILRQATNGYGSQVGAVTQILSPNGRWLSFSHDGSNRITEAKDNIGRTVRYTYDAGGRLWKVTDPAGGVTEYAYDGAHRMTTIKDARGITFLRNEYDSNGRVVKQTQADGSTYRFAYALDAAGKVTQTTVTNPRGVRRRTTFNAAGYTMTDAYGVGTALQQKTSYTRQAGTNHVLSETDPLGRKVAYEYNADGQPVKITHLAGTTGAVSESFTYEPRYGQVASATDALGHTTSFSYDAKGNLTSTADALRKRTSVAYNAVGQPVSITDPVGRTTRFRYDFGDLASVTDPNGRVTTQFIDAGGRPVGQTDALGSVTLSRFDALNQTLNVTNALGGATKFAYDRNGNRLGVTDARGGVTSYRYDNMDRLRSRKDPLGRSESYAYDLAGNLTKFTDRKGQATTYAYDVLDRLVKTTYADGSTITNTYDAGNRLTKVVDSLAGAITPTYDRLDRVTSESTPQGKVSYAYDAVGRRTRMTVQGQPSVAYTYDNADRLTKIAQGTSGTSISYDNADRPIAMSLPNGITVEYAYDAASQLTGMTYRKGTTTIGNLTYAYDAAGRRTKMGGSYARTSIPQAMTSATYDAANRLTKWGTTTLTYDANGNLTGDGTKTYTWNARNELASMTGGGTTASFAYDASGRRVKKTINGVSTGFLFDGDNPVQELNGTAPTANLLTGLGVDSFLSRTDSAGSRTMITDGLGSTIGLVDSAGVMKTSYTYEPFGKTTVGGEANGNSYEYTGREDDRTGLYYNRARYYNPTWGRFISEDPIGFAGGDTNLYAYVWNSPANFTDPSGLSATCAAGAAVETAMYVGGNILSGRKTTVRGVVKAAVVGCVTNFIPGGKLLGKALGKAAGPLRKLGARTCKVNSFSADTEVATPDGEEEISDIEIGDEVLAYDEDSGTTGSYKVTDTISHKDPVVFHVTLDGERLVTTKEHPFYTRERGWVDAGKLRTGMQVRRLDGTYGVVDKVQAVHKPQRMYNLTVEDAHTFFVGDEHWLVHNCPSDAGFTGGNSKTIKNVKIKKNMVRVDLEYPTGGSTGNVHVQIKGPDAAKIFINDPNDLSSLPRGIQNNQDIVRAIHKAFDLLNRHQP